MSEINLSDIEQKMRQIQSEVGEAGTAAKPAGLAIGTAIAAAVLGLAYILGNRKAEKQTTIIEVRRV